MYVYNNNINNFQNCFYGKNNSKMLNIYMHKNSVSLSSIKSAGAVSSLVGANITWYTNSTNSSIIYITPYNIHIHMVDDVSAARAANGD